MMNTVPPHITAANKLACALVGMAKEHTPELFRDFLGIALTNVMGAMSDEYWKRFATVKPCGRAGCDCHLTVVPALTGAFKVLREDWQEHVERSISE